MSGKIEISRELAERICGSMDFELGSIGGTGGGIEELRAILAAPVVERQEPVAYIVEAIDPNNGHLRRRGLHWHSVETLRETRDFKEWMGGNVTKEQPLYTSPPAPVAVVLPERMPHPERGYDYTADGWNACLDKVKEINQ